MAAAVGFPRDQLLEEEIEVGVVAALGGVEQRNYVAVRNHIIARWRRDVMSVVTLGDVSGGGGETGFGFEGCRFRFEVNGSKFGILDVWFKEMLKV